MKVIREFIEMMEEDSAVVELADILESPEYRALKAVVAEKQRKNRVLNSLWRKK